MSNRVTVADAFWYNIIPLLAVTLIAREHGLSMCANIFQSHHESVFCSRKMKTQQLYMGTTIPANSLTVRWEKHASSKLQEL